MNSYKAKAATLLPVFIARGNDPLFQQAVIKFSWQLKPAVILKPQG
jgi:hypothetical protein